MAEVAAEAAEIALVREEGALRESGRPL
eukprot:SAG11_NODE_7175_length_1183_cov_1.128229_2_plen_27_part_01